MSKNTMTVAEVLQMTPEQRAQSHLDLEQKASDFETKNSEKDLELKQLRDDLNKAKDDLAKDLVEVKAEAQAMSEREKLDVKEDLKTIFSNIAKEIAVNYKGNNKGQQIETKAALVTFGNIGNADVANFTNLGVVNQAFRRFRIVDLFKKTPISTVEAKVWEQTAVNRNGQGLVDCTLGTFSTSATWAKRDIRLFKLKDIIDICLDMIDNLPFIQGQMQNLLFQSIPLLFENSILGVGTGISSILGIRSFAVQLTTAQIASPIGNFTAFTGVPLAQRTIEDLLTIVDGQVNNALEGAAKIDTIVINPVDFAKYRRKRSTTGDLINHCCMIDGTSYNVMLDGQVMVVTTVAVAANTFFAFDSTKGEILYRSGQNANLLSPANSDLQNAGSFMYSDENNNNFEREIVSLKAYIQTQFNVPIPFRNSFYFCPDINTALGAI